MKNLKYRLPPFFKLNTLVPLDLIRDAYKKITSSSLTQKEIFTGRACQIIDLTYINPNESNFLQSTYFAGSSTERAVSNYQQDLPQVNLARRLQVGVQRNPLADDRNHNCIKPEFQDLPIYDWLRSIGNVSKVTFSTLSPRGWWPSHYDFSPLHSAKINIPVFTNENAISLSWNQRDRSLHKVHMKENEIWWVNTAFKHTSFNWGNSPRTFLLASFRDTDLNSRVLNDCG